MHVVEKLDSAASAGQIRVVSSPTVASLGTSLAFSMTALAFYLTLSVVLFGLHVIASPGAAHVGFGADPAAMMWFIAWWPYAIWHHLNPFITYAVWSSTGYNLTWATSMPAVAFALAPVTATLGVVVAYNLAALLAPALSAWCAFLLCRRLTGRFSSALVGGLIYGFSPYQVAHVIGGQLVLTLNFIPPLCVLLVLLLVKNEITNPRFTVAFALVLVVQCLISTEVLATMTVFGAIALIAAVALLPASRGRLIATLAPIALAYVSAAVILSPFLYYALVKGSPPKELIFPPSFFSADLLSFIVPGWLLLMNPFGADGLASRFTGNLWENGSYFGIPLLALSGLWLWRSRREPAARWLALTLSVVLVCALGPVLQADGRRLVPLPWALADKLPLVRHALPVRFSSYAFLILAVIVSMALCDPGIPFRNAAMTVILVSIFPNPAFLLRPSRYDTPQFFARGLYRNFLKPGANVLVLPYGWNGPSMAWQAQSQMYFRMPGGYIGPTPLDDFRQWPLSLTLTNSVPVPDPAQQLKAFSANYGIDVILVADGATRVERNLAASLDLKPVKAGGVLLYYLPKDRKGDLSARQLHTFQRSTADEWFMELLCAAKRFLADGHELADLSPTQLRSLGVLSDSGWIASLPLLLAGTKKGTGNGLWVGPGPDGTIAVGLPVWRAAAGQLISSYGGDATSVLYPYPSRYAGALPGDESPYFLMMTLRSSVLKRCDANSAKWWATPSR
jgi:hypothetical protein